VCIEGGAFSLVRILSEFSTEFSMTLAGLELTITGSLNPRYATSFHHSNSYTCQKKRKKKKKRWKRVTDSLG